jgi:hypothetical protein
VLSFANYSHYTHSSLILPSKIAPDQWLTTVTADDHRKNIFHICVEGKQEKNRENTASIVNTLTTDANPRESVPVPTTNLKLMYEKPTSVVEDSKSKNQKSTPSGHAQICSFLIDQYTNGKLLLTGKDNDGNTPLHLASKFGREDLCEIFIHWMNPYDQSWFNSKQRTPLHECAKHGHWELVKMMLAKYNPETRVKLLRMQDINLKTTLHLACKEGSSIFIFNILLFTFVS